VYDPVFRVLIYLTFGNSVYNILFFRWFGAKSRLMNLLKKIERNLSALALIPLADLEARERKRRFEERLRRHEQRQQNLR
jgi:hypothetical protein